MALLDGAQGALEAAPALIAGEEVFVA